MKKGLMNVRDAFKRDEIPSKKELLVYAAVWFCLAILAAIIGWGNDSHEAKMDVIPCLYLCGYELVRYKFNCKHPHTKFPAKYTFLAFAVGAALVIAVGIIGYW